MADGIALFDFDNTLTTSDTLRGFAKYYFSGWGYAWRLVLAFGIRSLFKLGIINHHAAKRWFLRITYHGEEIEKLSNSAKQYCMHKIPYIIDREMLLRLRWHKQQGHRIFVVSASLDLWLKPWCDQYGIELIATEAKTDNGRLVAELPKGNCYGDHKLVRIKEKVNLADFSTIYAYGDDHSDLPMLNIANFIVYRGKNITHKELDALIKEKGYV